MTEACHPQKANRLQFSIISTTDDFDALEDRWNDLIAQCDDCSVFQSFSWLSTWWHIFSADRQLRIILAHDQDRLVGLLPLYIEHTQLLPAVGLRKLRLVGYGGDTAPDDLGAILGEGDHPTIIETLVDGIESLRGEWDMADLEDLDPNALLIQAMETRRQGEVELVEGARISYVNLPESFDAYLAMLSSNRRWKMRRGRKKLLERTNYRFHVVSGQAELDQYFPELVRLHQERWDGRAEDIGFSTMTYVDFHRQVMAKMLEQDCLRLMFLIGEEGPIAANYCYRWRGGFYFFQGGIAKAYDALRIGEVLMGHAIEQAITEGMQVFDMLRGEHDYKKSLTGNVRSRTHLRLNQPTLRTRSYRALRAGYRRVRGFYGPGADDAHGAEKPEGQSHAA